MNVEEIYSPSPDIIERDETWRWAWAVWAQSTKDEQDAIDRGMMMRMEVD